MLPKLKSEHIDALERILDNKPIRPRVVSTLEQRWQELAAQGVEEESEEVVCKCVRELKIKYVWARKWVCKLFQLVRGCE